MRKLLQLTLLLTLLFCQSAFAQLASWDFFGKNTGVATLDATFSDPSLAAIPFLSRGATAAASTANNSFRTTGFSNNGIALTNTDYFQVTLKPGSGKKISLSSINATFAGTATYYASPGVTSRFAYSLDGTNFTFIGNDPIVSIASSLTISPIDLSAIIALQNIDENTTVTIRYFASGQTVGGGWGFFSGAAGSPGLSIDGTVAINTASTNPALLTKPISLAFGNQNATTNSIAQSFVINGGSLPSGINVNASAPFFISKDNNFFSNTLTYSLSDVATNPTVYIRFSPTTGGLTNGTVDITTITASAASATVKLSGTGIITDLTPPTNTATFPKINNIAATSFDLLTNIDEAGISYYVVIPATGTAPATVAQVLAGQDGNGTPALKAGSAANIAGANAISSISGLTASTNYGIYVVAKDAATVPNVQTAITTLSATTTAVTTPPTTHLVISEVYGGGGNAGSTYKNDFIELYNPADVAVNLSGYSIQHTSATGIAWTVTPLTGTIAAKGFYLIQGAAGAAGIADLPTPDLNNPLISLGATAAKVILSNSTVALTGDNPSSVTIVDKVGIGATTTGFEAAPATAFSNITSVERKASATSTVSTLSAGGAEEFNGNGYDSDNNSTDFVVTTPNPQNSSFKEPAGANHIVISEVYGGGGNTGAAYTNDFIELYNPTLLPVDLTNWSVQYSSASGTSWAVTPLSGTIAPKSFYLIQEAVGTNGTIALPTPDKIGTIPMAAGAGKVLLANVTTAQTGAQPNGPAVIDFVGYGTATSYEGTGPAPVPSATLSVERKASAASDATSMGANGDEEFNGNGYDSDDNAADFVARLANPQNSTSVEPIVRTGPYIVTTPKAISFGNLPVNTTSVYKTYVISSGNLTDPVTVTASGAFTISKNYNTGYTTALNYTTTDLMSNQIVYVKFNPTVLGYTTGSIAHVSNGAVSTNVVLTGSSIDPTQTAFNFEDCTTVGSSALSDGFYQYSVTGAQTWGCTTTFGHKASDATGLGSEGNALQMNGYASGNVVNEDWLISPSLNISAMTYPILSFWTRSAFDGPKLQLKVSTNYTGTGNPNLATWTTIEGKFPEAASDVWTKSDYIDLSAYKTSPNVYVAIIYTSTTSSASRWTVDDFEVTNSLTPPPVDISVSTSGLNFGYQVAGSTSTEKSFTFSAGNLTGDVTLTAPNNFTISDSSNGVYGSSITYTKATTNNTIPVVYAKFSPTVTNTAYADNVTITTQGSANKTVNLSGNSYELTNTLEVVNWNIEWFGSPKQAPTDDALQALNVKTIVNNINADIYGFAEVVDTTLFRNTVLPAGYNVIFSEFGSYANDKVDPAYPLTQKLAFMYRTDLIKPVQTYGVFRDVYYADSLNNRFAESPYKNWSSGRFPFLMEAKVLVNGAQETVYFIEIHAKANTGDVIAQNDAYDRRLRGNIQLKAWIDANLPNKKVIILGDFNDVLNPNKTIAPKPAGTGTSYISFINDPANYVPLTLPLSLAGKRSTAGFNTVIDNVIVTRALNDNYISNTAQVLDYVTTLVNSYTTTTTDHYPILTRYFFPPSTLPITMSSFTATAVGSNVNLKWTTSSETNNNYFTIERSTDGKNFIALKQVKGAGTSSIVLNYSSVDENPVQGVNYYRIRQTDFDGKTTTSDIRAVTVLSAKTNTLSVYPNPATDKITLSLTHTPTSANLVISAVDGRIIFNETGSLANLNEKLNAKLSRFTYGVYIVKLTAEGQVYKSKFIKQ